MGNGATAAAGARPASSAKVKPNQQGGIAILQWFTESWLFQTFILLCIVANAAILGYDAHFGEQNRYHSLIEQWNQYFLYIFTAELVLEFLAQGFSRYIRNGWNIFDVIVVAISYIAVNPAISALRTLRVIRVFRLISAVPQMRRVVEALFSAMPGIIGTFAILCVVFYIGAVMATTLFRDADGFHDLGQSALSLFALTQFDGWGDTIRSLSATHPYAWVFIMSFTVIAAFAVLNLFIGVIVEAVQAAPKEIERETMQEVEQLSEQVADVQETQEDAATVQRNIMEELRALRAEVAAMRAGLAPPSQ
ncbi:ion transporter [Terricaulis sp.]|uniref:ion transporter n=1 Tax=Terricaulis sp. TaxID=2768686 RepID=UPI003782EC56